MGSKIGRNEPCWCGSSRKYKHCHLGREKESPLPPKAAVNQLRRFFKLKQCLHPEASQGTCSRVVAAHTIQRKGPLEGITDSTGHCLTFYPPDGRNQPVPQRRGWKEASTFAGFCGRHDGRTFAPLESTPFTGSAEQCFLLAYRAECHELYQKQASDRAREPLRRILDRGTSPGVQRTIQEMQDWEGAGVKKGLDESRRNKRRMDHELLDSDFRGWRRLFICFRGEQSVVSTGCPTPNRTLSGRILQTLHDRAASIQRLYVGAVRDGDVGGIVLTWRTEDAAPESLVADLRALDIERVPGVVVQFIFAHIENTYFSPAWWKLLSDEQRDHIWSLASLGNPYYVPWDYMEDVPVPWTSVKVSNEWRSG